MERFEERREANLPWPSSRRVERRAGDALRRVAMQRWRTERIVLFAV